MLNEYIEMKCDYTDLKGDEGILTEYTGDFLQGFYVKDAEEFENWMLKTREILRQNRINKLYEKIQHYIDINDYEKVENYGRQIINIDAFDERAYRILMKSFINIGAFNKAIDVYRKLTETLQDELGVYPDGETRALYEKAIELKSAKVYENKKKEEFFYGRQEQLNTILMNYYGFLNSREYKAPVIIGEAGVGKSRLKRKFIDLVENDLFIIEAECYQAEENYILKPWNNVFSKLWDIINNEKIDVPLVWKNIIASVFPIFYDDADTVRVNPVEGISSLKFQVIEEAIIGVLKKVSTIKKVIIVFEDIQWMDATSLSLFSSILLHGENNHIFFLCTCRNEYTNKIESFISTMIKYNKIEKTNLQRFTKEEVREFSLNVIPECTNNEELMDKIYQETEGNAFFLVEMLNSIKESGSINIMSSKMQDIIKSRFLDISEKGKELLKIISMFFDEAPLDVIVELTGNDELEVIDIVEELEKKFIIKEIENNSGISFVFTHQKLREFIYLQLSYGKRKILHNKIGKLLEKNLKNDKTDILTYSKLIYHFKNANNKESALKYSIKNADICLDFAHELFPVINYGGPILKSQFLNSEQVNEYLNEIEVLLNEVADEINDHKKILEYKMVLYHMYGRYFIRDGEYLKGKEYIQRMINNALQIEDINYALKGYRQMIYCGIQTHDVDLMNNYLEIALPMAAKLVDKKEYGILLRLKGLGKIMSCSFKEAEELLIQSIKIFEVISKDDDRFILNIAAAYNYIGEIRRYNMQFQSALSYYDKAITITEGKKVLTGLSLFNTNAGQAAFEIGDYHRAKTYFLKALKLFEEMDSLWGRSTAEGYMSFLEVKEGLYKEALNRLKKADYYSQKIKSPMEIGIIYRIKAEIKSNMKNNRKLNDVFKNYLNLELEDYCSYGIEILKNINHGYEADILKVLKSK
ncbi:hypothetical protein Q428_14240 [Fervidicella metallireducens AeB]|uniref:Bacterial transcriptional activator domain-containing protein n=1 Tax=Fervidicella metallireducens AeB TaxID=1403537 RepID=A0A017RR68_9CLOT|nr:BTAD domain-containing putative transcriptional regulator [Fervidicella metallireducens]EYE87263.1 hypothetical protein Q428_14240 [Fervidicella metallireducens AeB]